MEHYFEKNAETNLIASSLMLAKVRADIPIEVSRLCRLPRANTWFRN